MGFTDQQISKWANDYEKELCSRGNFICDRFSLAIKKNFNEYELPNYITNIRMVLYKGREVYPKGFTSSIMTQDTPFQTTGATPYEYVISGKGLRVIKFYPTPMEDVAEYAPTAPETLFGMGADMNGVIIEFYRTPNSSQRLPDWCRRYLLKDYICWKAFKSDGPGSDLRAAMYYEQKLSLGMEYIGIIESNMHQACINILGEDRFRTRGKPARPVLPNNFGLPTPYV